MTRYLLRSSDTSQMGLFLLSGRMLEMFSQVVHLRGQVLHVLETKYRIRVENLTMLNLLEEREYKRMDKKTKSMLDLIVNLGDSKEWRAGMFLYEWVSSPPSSDQPLGALPDPVLRRAPSSRTSLSTSSARRSTSARPSGASRSTSSSAAGGTSRRQAPFPASGLPDAHVYFCPPVRQVVHSADLRHEQLPRVPAGGGLLRPVAAVHAPARNNRGRHHVPLCPGLPQAARHQHADPPRREPQADPRQQVPQHGEAGPDPPSPPRRH